MRTGWLLGLVQLDLTCLTATSHSRCQVGWVLGLPQKPQGTLLPPPSLGTFSGRTEPLAGRRSFSVWICAYLQRHCRSARTAFHSSSELALA